MTKIIKATLDEIADAIIEAQYHKPETKYQKKFQNQQKEVIKEALAKFVVDEEEGRNKIFEPPYIILKVQYEDALRNINDLRQEILYLTDELEKHKIMKSQLSERLYNLTKHQHGLSTPKKGGDDD